MEGRILRRQAAQISHVPRRGNKQANDGKPRDEIFCAFREMVLEIKDAMQVKADTQKEINTLKEKGKKYEEQIGKLNEEVRILKEGQEDLKILKEVQEILISHIQEMKRRLAEVDHYRASPSQRSQPSESRLNLRIENEIKSPNYKKETVTTKDKNGHIKVAMYDGAKIMDNSQQKEVKLGVRVTVPTGVRVLEGVSNPFKVQESKTKPKLDESTTEESNKKGKKPTPPDPTQNLVQPTSTHAIQHESNKKGKKPSSPDPTQNLVQPTSTHATQHVLLPQNFPDRGKHIESPTDGTGEDNGLSYTPATAQQMVEGNGQANCNGHRSSQQIPMETLVVPTSTNSMQHGQGPVNPDEQQCQGLLQKSDRGKHTEFPTDDTGEANGLSYSSATVQQMVEGNRQAQNSNGQNYHYGIQEQFLGQSTSSNSLQRDSEQALNSNGPAFSQLLQAQMWRESTSLYPMPHGQVHSLQPPNDLQVAVNQHLPAHGQHPATSFPNGSSEFAQNPSQFDDIQLSDLEDVLDLYDKPLMQETDATFTCGRVLFQWDTPHVELKKHWNFLDQLMPLYSTKSRFHIESFPTTSLMDKAHKLLASISSGGSVSKMITSGMRQATQTPQRIGVLIRSIGPYDSEDEPPVKKQRHAKYQLRFVNRVCSDYYTQEQIKSEDGTFLKVALYDENNLVVTSGRLSSASVEVVLLHGDFNAEGQDYWTGEEFSTCLVHPQSAKEPPALGGDRILALTDGEADLGNVNFRTSSFHARTGKFKMGVVITNLREENVQEGITSSFLVRVRLGEEPSRHRVTSLESLLRVRVKLPNQVCVPLERDAKENVSASSALHHQSSQMISVLETSLASDRSPEPSSQVISVLGTSTASDPPPEPPSQVISDLAVSTSSDRPPEPLSQVMSILGASTSSDRPTEPSSQAVASPSALLKEQNCAGDVNDEEDPQYPFIKIRKRIERVLLALEKNKHAFTEGFDRMIACIQTSLDRIQLERGMDLKNRGRRKEPLLKMAFNMSCSRLEQMEQVLVRLEHLTMQSDSE